jgi:DNA-nicking Smr family endonuclease
MAKARRYKEEINTLLKNKKIELFLKNNERDLVINMINKRENFVDLHGLSYEESKMLIKKKISDIDRKRDSGLIDGSKKFCLNIITGLGKHSKDNKAILLPRISSLLKSMNYFVKIERDKGTIRLYL